MNCKSKQTLTSLVENFVRAITQHLPHYQRTILTLKKNNFDVIGYVRKSPGSEKPETRIRLLQQMVTNLKDRSLVDTVYVFPSCSSSDPFAARDVGSETAVITKKPENVSGNTQGKIKASGALRMDIITVHGYCRHVADMLHHVQATKHDLCLVSIDFAGLTTNLLDLKNLLSQNPRIQKNCCAFFF